MSEETSALFAMPSFFEGAGRILDFGDTLTEYNQSLSGDAADVWAVTRDFRAVGADLRAAVAQFAEELAAS